jgi:APA family basic amino acid/polyamine antiporter
MLGSPRAWFAFGRAGVLPASLARVHPRFHTPHVAIIAYACGVGALAISSSFTRLAILANVAALTLYLMCVAASYELQRRDVRAGGTPFAVPGGPLIPIAAAAVIIWLLTSATRREFAVEALALSVASVLYWVRRRSH